jgi:acyl-lipid omega-6 desaturase (Delta-12 desaturase)
MPQELQFGSHPISEFVQPKLRPAIVQLLNTFVPYSGLWILMVLMVQSGYPFMMILPLMVAAAGFLVRIFIIFHDCCHGSFFSSRRANRILGYITGVLTFTPFEQWRRTHARHHDTVGNLDRRGGGDIWTLTAEEYLASKKFKRFEYRLVRNPLIMLVFGPAVLFPIVQRFYGKHDRRREHVSVIVTDILIVAAIVIAALTIGIRTYVLIQLPVSLIAGGIGIWLFYVQHQFKGVYWARQEEWDPMRAALEGSSYLKLPSVLQWFTGNIGLHHIHHIQQRIPNYRLQQCFDVTPDLQTKTPLTLWECVKSLNLKLWDEKRKVLIGFRALEVVKEMRLQSVR